MKIEERLNRLEVNQMHIIHLLEEILHHVPKQPEEHIEKKCPPDEEAKWTHAMTLLKLERNSNQYALDRDRVTSLCNDLHRHPDATEENKEHFKELELTGNKMAKSYAEFDPLENFPDFYEWSKETIKRDDITSPLSWLIARRFKLK